MPSSMPNFAASTSMVPICAILPSVDPFCPFWPSLLFLLLKIETVSHFCNRRQRDAIFHAQFCTSMYLHDAHFCHLAIWKPFLSILASPMPILAVSTTDISQSYPVWFGIWEGQVIVSTCTCGEQQHINAPNNNKDVLGHRCTVTIWVKLCQLQ